MNTKDLTKKLDNFSSHCTDAGQAIQEAYKTTAKLREAITKLKKGDEAKARLIAKRIAVLTANPERFVRVDHDALEVYADISKPLPGGADDHIVLPGEATGFDVVTPESVESRANG